MGSPRSSSEDWFTLEMWLAMEQMILLVHSAHACFLVLLVVRGFLAVAVSVATSDAFAARVDLRVERVEVAIG